MASSTGAVEQRSTLLTEHDPIDVLKRLPSNIFPIRIKLNLPRSRDRDSVDDRFATPDYPVSLQQPRTPYIPETTVYFDNPAERPPDGKTAWRPEDFQTKFTDLLEHIDSETAADVDDLKLESLEIVEVPDHFVTTDADTGYLAVEPKLYERQGELRLARFEKVGSLTATEVRDRLDNALPGETRTPTRLSRVSVVNAKQSRHSRRTTGRAGQARYYTENDAEQVDDLSLTPAVYQLQETSRTGDRTRPLTPALSELDELLPGLMRGAPDLLTTVKFVGQERERTEFHAREVLD